jgi:hypothetical protein
MPVLLLSIDSLRLDAAPRANPSQRWPRFDQATRHFGFCSRLFSTSSATRPVHSSLFTGLYPSEHGVVGQRRTRLRPGIEHLFARCQRQQRPAVGFSEAASVFAGLDFADAIAPLAPDTATGLAQLRAAVATEPALLFAHYWGAHTPYGAADGRADGEVLQLLRRGRRAEVEARYRAAAARVAETQVAPLLEQLDLRRWAVFIFGDHGESWLPDEPYHGQSLRNSVLRVPLYFHVPGSGNAEPVRPLLSMVDLFPTLLRLLGLDAQYQGPGVDVWAARAPGPWLAEIEPLAQADDLQTDSEAPSVPLVWAVWDTAHKLTVSSRGEYLERLLSEDRVDAQTVADALRAGRQAVLARSSTAHLVWPASDANAAARLDQRLRDLGYLA